MPKVNSVKCILSYLFFTFFLFYASYAAPLPKHIAITQFVEHVAADAVRQGLLDELAKEGYREGETLTVSFANAQGNVATAGQIARKFIGANPDIIIAITTPSAQAIVKAVGRDSIPIVFTAVTDPVGAGLVPSLKSHKGKVTGVMDAPPLKEQFKFIKTLLPSAKKIGVLYNPGDNGSIASLNEMRKEAKAQGYTLIEVTPVKSSDIQGAVLQLVGKVDAIYVPLDNMLVSAMETLSSLILRHNIPLFTADSGSVKVGAFACLGYSYFQTGRKTGEIVVEILEGKNPSDITVATPSTIDIFINRHALEKLQLTLPETVETQAHYY